MKMITQLQVRQNGTEKQTDLCAYFCVKTQILSQDSMLPFV